MKLCCKRCTTIWFIGAKDAHKLPVNVNSYSGSEIICVYISRVGQSGSCSIHQKQDYSFFPASKFIQNPINAQFYWDAVQLLIATSSFNKPFPMDTQHGPKEPFTLINCVAYFWKYVETLQSQLSLLLLASQGSKTSRPYDNHFQK